MDVPNKGFKINGTDSKSSQVLKLLKNLYCQKQADRVRNQHTPRILIEIVYKSRIVDNCVY